MRAWENEILLIRKGDAEGAANLYQYHRPDLSWTEVKITILEWFKKLGKKIKKESRDERG